jgi:hypothetical protein
MRYLSACCDDDHSVELAMAQMSESLVLMRAVYLADLHSRSVLKSDDLPSMQILSAPRNHIRKEFYYHTNKIYRQRKICNENNILFFNQNLCGFIHIFLFPFDVENNLNVDIGQRINATFIECLHFYIFSIFIFIFFFILSGITLLCANYQQVIQLLL